MTQVNVLPASRHKECGNDEMHSWRAVRHDVCKSLLALNPDSEAQPPLHCGDPVM